MFYNRKVTIFRKCPISTLGLCHPEIFPSIYFPHPHRVQGKDATAILGERQATRIASTYCANRLECFGVPNRSAVTAPCHQLIGFRNKSTRPNQIAVVDNCAFVPP